MNDATYTLLVVDDNEMNRDMLSRRLERKGYRVRPAASGEEALALLETEVIDLVLLDIMMPGLSGIETLKVLRQSRSQTELPVIMATAKVDSEDIVEALSIGANDYVTKPLDFPVVLARIESQLRSREQAAGKRRAACEPCASELAPGAVVAGRYRLGAAIGCGNFGTIYRARHLALEVDVALKILHPGLGVDARMRERFQREGISACRIKHPNAVAVLDFGVTDKSVAYLAMELLEGTSLAAELGSTGPVSAARAAEIVLPICDVLAEAHAAGVIHRDVKPENVFLHRTGRTEVVKVLDFGLARLVGEMLVSDNLTIDGWVLGTPAYMSPERFRNQPADGRSDVYSLGVMLFLMLTGRLPYVARSGDPLAVATLHLGSPVPSLRALAPWLPPSVEAVVQWALAKDPAGRPDAAALGRGLALAVSREVEPQGARPAAPAPEAGSAGATLILGSLDKTILFHSIGGRS